MILPTLGFTWMPEVDGGEFNVGLPRRTGLAPRVHARPAARELSAMRARASGGRRSPISTIGGGFRGSPNNGQVFVKLKPKRRARAHA